MKKVVIILLSMFLLMCCAFGLTACGGGGDDSGDNPNTEQPNNPDDGDNDNKPTTPEEPKEELTPSDIYKKVNPSVVFILIDNLQGIASGTGFFIDDEGTIVTNYHVIEDGTAGVIQLSDGTQAAIGNVLGYDENLDIAILETTATNTTPVEIGNSSLVEVGDTVYAIGYPAATTIGFSSSTFTTGMVSMNRSIGGYNYIQSTVDITHGNSGGTLINTYGEVIGITTAGLNVGDVDYMNLSIPIQRVDTVALDDNESLLIVTKRHYPVYARFYNGSSLFTTQTLKYEQTATVPSSSPSKTGYTFAGWYADSGLTTPFDFSTKILEDTRIYAKFDINTYTVTYNLNSGKWNGTTPDSTWTVNNSGTALPVPVRSGYLFEGWTDSSGNFVDKLPTSSNLGNVTYNARWIEGAEGLTISNGTVTDYNGTATSVKVPDSFRGVTVTRIGNSAFSGATNLQSITLSDTITSIGSNAFADCNINEVYAPSSCAGTVAKQTGATTVVVTSGNSIGNSAFSGCTNLTSITLPNELTTIGGSAFYGCTGLENITIPNGVTTIDSSAFYGCTNLADISMPNGLTTIGNYAFSGCIGLKNIALPNGLTTIRNSAFYGCTGLESITIPNGVTVVETSAFSGCNNIQKVYAPSTCAGIVANQTGASDVTVTGGVVIENYAFTDCPNITTLTLSEGITTIEDYAFSGCDNLQIVYSPSTCAGYFGRIDSVEKIILTGTYIAPVAFEKYSKLPNIVLSDTFISIDDSAFSGCTGLTSIEIPDSVTSIGSSAFSGCTSLTSIEIPDSVTSIGSSAFSGCTGLTSIEIPDGVTSIEGYAFSGCTGLTSIEIPDGVTSIDRYAFRDCSNLTNIVIPDGVTSIGDYAFENCSSLTSIAIPDGVTSIGDKAFYDCSKLTEIYYNAIEVNDFNSGNYIFGFVGNDSDGVSVVFGTGIKHIPAYLFYMGNITSVTIPNSVISIGNSAFPHNSVESVYITDLVPWCKIGFSSGNNNPLYGAKLYLNNELVKELNIPNGVVEISDYTFFGCASITTVTISNGVANIGNAAFSGCTGLTSIEIPDSVTSIGGDAFEGCTSLTSIEIPDSVTSIGMAAFTGTKFHESDSNWENGVLYIGKHLIDAKDSIIGIYLIKEGTLTIADGSFANCTELTSIVIPNSITSIGRSVFEACTSLTSIEIPNSVTSIGIDAFSGCTGLTSIVIPDSVTSIGGDAFEGCTSLTSIEIPDSVTSIGSSAFFGCSGLTSIKLSNSLTRINLQVFYGCTSLTSIEIPNSVTYIDVNALRNTGLTSIEIPDSVTSIGMAAFMSCSKLTSIEIPDSVTSIGSGAFKWCRALTDIIYNGTIEQWETIEKGYEWNYNTGNYIVHCLDGDIAKN